LTIRTLDLEWKVVYVGSAEDESKDQVLEEVMVGPVQVGTNRFILQCPPPNPSVIQNEDLIGVTVLLVTCSYMDAKFVQIGYYVNNEYAEPFEPEQYPNPVDISKLYRNLLADQPRVTRYPIDWTGNQANNTAPNELAVEEQAGEDDEMNLEEDQDMGDDEEDDSEGNEEDENVEIDLEGEDEEGDGEGEEGDADAEGEGDEYDTEEDLVTDNMVPLYDESNTMDVDRMLQ